MKFILPAMMSLLLLAGAAAAEDVFVTYKDGQPVYTDRPISPESRPVNLRTSPDNPDAVAAEQASAEEWEETRRRRAADEALVAGLSEEEAAERIARCEQARQRAETYNTAQRLYEDLPDGGRRYLSDEELTQARDESRQDIVRYCSPR